jgi:restriction endonuclease Mrr
MKAGQVVGSAGYSPELRCLCRSLFVSWCQPRINKEELVMQAVLRKYSGRGAKELFELLEKDTTELQKLLLPIQGFVSYTLARSGDGGFSMTVCNDKAGIDQSVQVAKDWVARNAANTGVGAPEVTAADVILHLK